MEAILMSQPETVSLTYDKSNPMAKKALDLFITLGLFSVKKNKSQIEIGLDEYRQGKYTIVNKGKSKI
ncbi:MAG: hypothetical protein FWH18_07175 [Marinilabiliaceae bacterium]|nr:hypothetical protein [Marinilabiliaceae bacterium]